ncbi:GNAT family N-acetyltransferase [Acerihabitans arboris]|uniref:GNAT family N-acetyltransferase n=1 Tax=Acerihabitans arboris TaxID=2691583 RepID=A0A845SSQ0_9GAMM|nr:GNAT family N-acetyltransferase [Acerihabitans arboris]NDL64115.1 GNAT family N-acetyltransferase [Acerihabitans arboris]
MVNIIIRHAEAGDYEQIHLIYAQLQVYSNTLQLPYPSQDLWKNRTAQPTPGHYSLAACIDELIVGELGIETNPRPRRRHVASFGMGARPDYHRRGVAAQLMTAMLDLCGNWLITGRIELNVYIDNPAAIALYKKFGFTIEGTARNFAFRNGQYVDVYYMSRVGE